MIGIMNTIISRFVLVLFIAFLGSCTSKTKEIKNNLSQIVGKRIQLIDSLNYYSPEKGFYKDSPKSQIKIITYIDGGCGSCLYDLENWKRLIILPQLKDVSFMFYVKCYDRNQLISVLQEINFSYPVIVDATNRFYEVNNLNTDKTYQTFLVDGNNKVLIVGNPLYSKQIENLYLRNIVGSSNIKF